MRLTTFYSLLIVNVFLILVTFSSCKKKPHTPSSGSTGETVATWTLIDASGGNVYHRITDIEQGDLGSIWIASVNGTAPPFTSKITTYGASMKYVQTIDSTTSPFLKSKVTSIGFDPSFHLYFGTQFYNTPGLSKELIIESGSGYTHYNTPGGTGYDFENFYFNSSGLWFGTGNQGLLNFNEPNFVNYNSWNSGIPYPNYINDLVRIDAQDFWIGTSAGLVRKAGTTFAEFNGYMPIDAMDQDSQGNIWMAGGSEPLLHWFNGSNIIDYTIPVTAGTNHEVIDLAVDSYNNVWVAISEDGLFRFNGTEWTHYLPSNSPLHSINVTTLKVDLFGNLWIGSGDMGVMRLNKYGTGH